MARVVVVGIGNVLNSDDGLGPYVARTVLASFDLDGDVEVMDAGTPGMDLLSLLHGAEAAVFVDAVRDAGAPGDVRRYDRDALLRGGTRAAMSPHEPGLREALLSLEFRGEGPSDVCLWGVVPEDLELGTRLSEAVRGSVPRVVEGVIGELGRLGIRSRKLAAARDPDIWWERRVAP